MVHYSNSRLLHNETRVRSVPIGLNDQVSAASHFIISKLSANQYLLATQAGNFAKQIPIKSSLEFKSNQLLEVSVAKVILIQPFQDVESHRGQKEDQGDEESREHLQPSPDLLEVGQLVQVAAAAIKLFR